MSETATPTERQAKVEAMLALLRNRSEETLRRMAELLVDTPDDQFFNRMEFDLRDLAHDLATDAQEAALQGGQKRAIRGPVSSAGTARETHDSSAIGPTA